MCQIELVAIGDELLKGMTLNSNVAFLGQQLLRLGYRVSRQTVLPDEIQALTAGLQEVFKRAQVVIVTGGLGPTCDDGTRQVVADLFGEPLVPSLEVREDLIKRFGQTLESLEDQVLQPKSGVIGLNPLGTAPAILLHRGDKTWILLPGVPREMQAIFAKWVEPWLRKRHPITNVMQSRRLSLHSLNENQIDPLLRELQKEFPQVEMGIYPGYGTVGLAFLSASDKELLACEARVLQRFAGYVYFSPCGTIEEAVHAAMIERKMTLCLAESCTGGRIAAQLSRLSGASQYLLGSSVVYANELKEEWLGVHKNLLNQCGAVSREVVVAMWEGLMARSHADFGVAVSGIAGPEGGTAEKPVGTIFAAVGRRGKTPETQHLFLERGDRETRIQTATNCLLGALHRVVVQGLPAF